MNTIKITLLGDGTTARIDKDFAVYKNSYRNVLIDIYVPTSILNLNLGYTHSVKIGAERTATNGAETTTKSYYVDYKATETIANVEYYVFERLLPREFVEIAGNETIVTNVVLFNNSSLTEIITSENVVLQIQDSNYILDDEIEDDDTVAEIEADITDLQERFGESETDIAELQGQVSTNTLNIAEHTTQIGQIIADLNIQETYIGKIEDDIEPIPANYEQLSTMLDDYVELHTDPSREPRNGDVIIYVYENPGTDKNYKFIYSVSTGWNYYELPPMEQASNTTFGLVKGSYNETRDVKVSIVAGEFNEIYVKNLITGNYKTLAKFFEDLINEQQAIINGTQPVELANRAVNDGNGNNIANTYLTQNAGATKEFVKDYSLPKEFYQTYFIEADGYTDRPPTEPVSGVQFTKQTSAIGEFEIFDIYRTNNSKMRLTAKNSSSTTIYIGANQNTTIQLKLLNYIKKPNENAQTLSVELSNELELTSGSIYKVDFQSNFNDLNNVFDADENDIVGQVLSVITQDIATTTFSVYSNEVYPSSQTMNVQSLVIVTQQGNLGEIPVYDLIGTITGTQIDFDFGENKVYTNTLARFVLRVSEQTQLPYNYTLNLVYDSQNVRLATPYNFLSGNATIQDLKQTNITFDAVNGTVIDFVGYINIDSGDNITVYVNEDKVNDVYYCTYGQTTTTEIANAINKGKLPVVIYNNRTYIYTHGTYYFNSVSSNYCFELSISGQNTWSYNSFTFEKTSNKVTSISNTSTNTQYPSAKCVYDAIQNVTIPIDDQLSSTSENPVQNKVIYDALAGKQGTLSSAQLDAVNSGIDSTKVAQIATNTNNITTINSKIPSQASSENQLADKAFVNSSIATNTADFIGTFATITALNSYSGTITNNDYANVVNSERDFASTTEMNAYDKTLLTNFDYGWIPNSTKYDLYRFDIETQTWGLRASNISKGDVTLITAYNRYTYNGTSTTWNWNYTINTSGFTASQWAALNSGATAEQIAKIGSSTLTTTATNLSDAVNELNSGKQSLIDSSHKLSADLVDDTNTTNKFVTESDKTNWNAKSTVSVSDTGTATDEVKYITVEGVEKKLASGITNYEVIDKVNSLPTATATSPDLIQIDGELYFKNVTIWDEPEQSGEDLQINQVYSATQSGSNLEIS